MANPIVHFEIPADDAERAMSFYQKLFGWKFKKFPMPGDAYYMIKAKDSKGVGIDGGLMKRQNPGQLFMNYILVPSVDQFLQKAREAGAEIVMERQELDGGMGAVASFKDPEGNMIGLHEMGKNTPRPGKSARKKKAKRR